MCSRISFLDSGEEFCMNGNICDDNRFLDTDGKHCVSECETNLWMQDKATQEKMCVTACPETAPIEEAGVCKTCADATNNERQFWNGAECVAACPLSRDNDNVCRPCVELDAKKPFWDGT